MIVINRPNALMPFLPRSLTKISEYLSNTYVAMVTTKILINRAGKEEIPDNTIMVVIVPGPTKSGVAMGTIATSECDSKDFVLGKPPSISMAIAIKRTPPPTCRLDMLTWKKLSR